ncbi:MAG: FAD-binding protein [Cytophagaceae bacterium]
MSQIIDVALPPEEAFDDKAIRDYLYFSHRISSENIKYKVRKRSIDARGRNVLYRLQLELFDSAEEVSNGITFSLDQYKHASSDKRVVIIGAGPAGLFAALRLLEYGIKPIVLERGKDVRSRRRDLAAINKEHTVNPESNYCFGEGGAGTYSDGKLYTRSKKRGDIRKILEVLVTHGATDEILVDAHPHIGTNKLPNVVTNLRERVIEFGGEVHFDAKVVSFVLTDGICKGVQLQNGETILSDATILATGHSARDIFEQLKKQKIAIQAKPFALGVRIEHPQNMIDQCQYHRNERGLYLPAASYSLVTQTLYKGKERGVFSFCMCPGGFIVPAATSPGELVVNGMSPSRRDSKFANSGMVVAVELEDIPAYQKYEELSALKFQQDVEQKTWMVGGKTQQAPAQRVGDFLQNKASSSLPETSYQPGLVSARLEEFLPEMIYTRLRQGLKMFSNKIKGYGSNEGVLVGVESRTSSPVLIPRDRDTLEHIEVKGLYPCGEGAGYAGGIMSAAMDGERVVDKIALQVFNIQ